MAMLIALCRTLYGFGEITSLDQYAISIRKPVQQATLQVKLQFDFKPSQSFPIWLNHMYVS